MTVQVLVIRPEPGASETARRAEALGLRPVVAPLFEVRALPWDAPEPAGFEAVLLTSANAARHGGAGLRRFAHLPCYAVGEATAAAARRAGFAQVEAGEADGAATVAAMAGVGIGHAFHPCGREHLPLEHPGLLIERRPVYAADAVACLPPSALDALERGAVVLLHSPRAASHFAALAEGEGLARCSIAIAAISANAAEAAGTGWRKGSVAPRPTDAALLEVAAELCQAMERSRKGERDDGRI